MVDAPAIDKCINLCAAIVEKTQLLLIKGHLERDQNRGVRI